MIIVSACLCGINCKYNGGNNINEKVVELLKSGKALPLCPEQLGGMSTPRPPHEISKGNGEDVLNGTAKVIDKMGTDNSKAFIRGAEETLKAALQCGAKIAILKSKSPSCGLEMIYDGTFTGTLKEGNGVTCEILMRNGIKVFTEEDI
jgi:uncharacterized protein YbbK (DUF523 family)